MAVTVNQSTGNILSEYAATNIQFVRTVHNENGIITPVFTGQIYYDRKDYLLDAEGNKIGIVTNTLPIATSPADNPNAGMIFLDPVSFGALFAAMPDPARSLGDQISDLADEKIHADLVARGILVA